MASETIVSFRDLDAWKVSMDLVLLIYSAASALPASERYELSAQMRRAAVSVPANIAEGQGYGQGGKNGRYLHHVRIALGSYAELVTLVEVANRLGFVTADKLNELEPQLKRTGQLLHGLARSLRQRLIVTAGSWLSLLGGLASAALFT